MNFVYYSHSDYSDVWPLLFGQCSQLLPHIKKTLLTDKGNAPFGWDVIYYDDSLPYQQRVVSCLEQLDDEVIIFHHEDMVLYEKPNLKRIKELIGLVESGEFTFIKLLRGGYNDDVQRIEEHSDLVHSPMDMVFTIQPTICKTKDLISMYNFTPGDSIWLFEANTGYTSQYFGFSGAMVHDKKDRKRGMHHYDSSVYPYVATAITKGKWYTSEYPELKSLLSRYGYDTSRRGEV